MAFRESDLYAPVRDFLVGKGYTVRAEVKHCDVAATRPGPEGSELLVVELKKGLTLALLTQGVKRQREADLVYLAIPRPKRLWFNRQWRDQLHLLRRLELGLILVDLAAQPGKPALEVVLDPVAFDRERSRSGRRKQRQGLLAEIKGRSRDGNLGGSTGVKLMTAYREEALRIAALLRDGQALSPAQLRKDPDDKRCATLLRRNVYGWFEKRGRAQYALSQSGQEALLAAEAPGGAYLAGPGPEAGKQR